MGRAAPAATQTDYCSMPSSRARRTNSMALRLILVVQRFCIDG